MKGVDGSPEDNWVEYHNTLLQYYLHIAEPETLSDEVWVLKIKQLEHIRKAESK
jgi:hypothetical protein